VKWSAASHTLSHTLTRPQTYYSAASHTLSHTLTRPHTYYLRFFLPTLGARFHLSHVLRHVLAFRGDSLRKLQLADLCIVVAPDDEGPHRCPLLVVVHNNGKNNPEGRVDTSAAMRHADDPTMCLHFAVALWLFMLFVVEQTPLPVEEFIGFDEGGVHTRPWFDAFILPGNQKSGKRGKTGPLCLKEEFSDRTMNTETKNAYARIDHPVEDTHHTVHLNRGVALRAAEDRGVPEGQLRRAACHRGTDALNQFVPSSFFCLFVVLCLGEPSRVAAVEEAGLFQMLPWGAVSRRGRRGSRVVSATFLFGLNDDDSTTGPTSPATPTTSSASWPAFLGAAGASS
jgi:hypothetical protein